MSDLATILDPAQLRRIQATHRGFLYQHLYAVAVLLSAPKNGLSHLRVERDEDIEFECGGDTLYLQVKTRTSQTIRPSDLGDTLTNFGTVRDAHVQGDRGGNPLFRVIANKPPSPALANEITNWASDTAYIFGEEGPDMGLPIAPVTLAELFDECVRLARSIVLSSLRPETLVWKLASTVSAASAGAVSNDFTPERCAELAELVAVQLHSVPQTQHYRPHGEEPSLASEAKTRILTALSGAGKTAWAGEFCRHAATEVLYFRCDDFSDAAFAPRFVREAAATLAIRGRVPANRLVLPGASGFESLTHLDAVLPAPRNVTALVDDAHKLSADTISRAVEAAPTLRWVFMGRPAPTLAAAAARIGVDQERFSGWSDDTIAAVLSASGCQSTPRDVAALHTITGGLPLFVLRSVEAIDQRACSVDAYVESLTRGVHETASVQELLLKDTIDSLGETPRKVIAAIGEIDYALSGSEWSPLLETVGVPDREFRGAVRELSARGLLQLEEGGGLRLHDAFRVVLRAATVLDDPTKTSLLDGLVDILAADLLAARSGSRVIALSNVLMDLKRADALSDFVTDHIEWIREFGEVSSISKLLKTILEKDDLDTANRFWVLNSLSFLEIGAGDVSSGAGRMPEMESLLKGLSNNERAAFQNTQVLVAGITGDTSILDAALVNLGELSTSQARVLRYNVACGRLGQGQHRRAANELEALASDYMADCGLSVDTIFAANPPELSDHLQRMGAETETIRHLADCFDASAKALRKTPATRGFAILRSLWAMKFFQLVEAPSSWVRVAQDAAEDMLVVSGPKETRKFMESNLLPTVKNLGLVDWAVPVRAQYAVVCAMGGDFATADREFATIENYTNGLSATLKAELLNQRGILADLKRKSQSDLP